MFSDYQEQVMLAYKNRRNAGTLSLNLMHPTSANLRAECVMACDNRFLKKDEKVYISFFGEKEDATAYLLAVKKNDAGKFRPLGNFLKGETTTTDEKNIEMLALLIGYEPRPYRVGQSYPATETGSSDPMVPKEVQVDNREANAPSTMNTDKMNEGGVREEKDKGYRGDHRVRPENDGPSIGAIRLLVVIAIAVIGAGGYWSLRGQFSTVTGREKCMYWAGDHYQPVACDQKMNGMPVFALDTVRLTHFKKVTRQDTITGRSLGSMWYIKLDGNIEFYTAGGVHPLHKDRPLRPMTLYILNKYIRHLE
jgi:hypothetical protein